MTKNERIKSVKKLIPCGNTKCWDYDPNFKCHCYMKTFLSIVDCQDYIPLKDKDEKKD